MKLTITYLIFLFLGFQFETKAADQDRITSLVKKWNTYLNEKNVPDLKLIYAEQAYYYGGEVSLEHCLGDKAASFEKNPIYSQAITSGIQINTHVNDIIKCEFTKTVSVGSKTNDYKAYLLIKKINGLYKIIGESDYITDNNLDTTPELGNLKDSVFVEDFTTKSNRKKGWLFGGLFAVLIILGLLGYLLKDKFKRKSTIPLGIITPEKQGEKNEIEKSPEEKGDLFEKYVIKMFREDKGYKHIDWRSDKYVDGISPESNQYPDFVIEFNHYSSKTKKRFAVECKWRKAPNGRISIGSDAQLERYRKYADSEKIEVFLILGIGGIPDNPSDLYVIPLEKIDESAVLLKEIEEFKQKMLQKNNYLLYILKEKQLRSSYKPY